MQGPGYRDDPHHTITLATSSHEWLVEHNGVELARSMAALELREAAYPTVIYFPREAVRFSFLTPSGTTSYCPFKGHANYFSLADTDVAWSYVTPYDEVSRIERYIAFYPKKVTVRRVE